MPTPRPAELGATPTGAGAPRARVRRSAWWCRAPSGSRWDRGDPSVHLEPGGEGFRVDADGRDARHANRGVESLHLEFADLMDGELVDHPANLRTPALAKTSPGPALPHRRAARFNAAPGTRPPPEPRGRRRRRSPPEAGARDGALPRRRTRAGGRPRHAARPGRRDTASASSPRSSITSPPWASTPSRAISANARARRAAAASPCVCVYEV